MGLVIEPLLPLVLVVDACGRCKLRLKLDEEDDDDRFGFFKKF